MSIFVTTLFSLFFSGQQALACACCTDPGTYFRGQMVPWQERVQEMESLSFKGSISQGFSEAASGLEWEVVGGKVLSNVLTLDIVGNQEQIRSSIAIHLNPVWNVTTVDLYDQDPESTSGPSLLKIIEISGVAKASHPGVQQLLGDGLVNLILRDKSMNHCEFSPDNWILRFDSESYTDEDLHGMGDF